MGVYWSVTRMPKWRFLLSHYRSLALISFHTIILVVGLNLLLAAAFYARDHLRSKPDPLPVVSEYRARFSDPQAYTRMSPDAVRQFLDEQDAMASIGLRYAPWVTFRSPVFHGRWLNTDDQGFRRTAAPSRSGPGQKRVYVFGGSTTFGYGEADDYTIPSFLQGILERRYPKETVMVRNFGQLHYYSSQEMLLLILQIKSGDVPDWAVFIDGQNDVDEPPLETDEPFLTPVVRDLWNGDTQRSKPAAAFSWIPMVRFARGAAARLAQPQPRKKDALPERYSPDDTRRISEAITSRYLATMRLTEAVCTEYGIQCRFIWQPSPFYKYDRSLHKRFPYDHEIPDYWRVIYTRMADHKSPHYLFLGDMLEHSGKKVFVDDVHYNEDTNEALAAKIAEFIDLGMADHSKPK